MSNKSIIKSIFFYNPLPAYVVFFYRRLLKLKATNELKNTDIWLQKKNTFTIAYSGVYFHSTTIKIN